MLSFGFSAETLVRERGKGFRGEVWVMGERTMSLKKNGEIPKDDRGGRQLGKFSAHLHHMLHEIPDMKSVDQYIRDRTQGSSI